MLVEELVNSGGQDSAPAVIGEVAHIRSPKPGGPRHDPHYPATLLHTYENLILLCGTHHAYVDEGEGRANTPSELVDMRTKHERSHRRNERLQRILNAYVADQFDRDDRVLFEQADLNGPRVENMFVDVPIASRTGTASAELFEKIARRSPPDVAARDTSGAWVVVGAAQAFLHPRWEGNALIVGGPGQGKSTLLQYLCQFHRSRLRDPDRYTGIAQGLDEVTATG